MVICTTFVFQQDNPAEVAPTNTDDASGDLVGERGRVCSLLCPLCPRRFAFQCRLAAHLRTHTNHRPFTCSDCGRGFTQRGYLVRHAAVHREARPFACPECGPTRTYKHYGSLVNHRRTQHGIGASAGAGKPPVRAKRVKKSDDSLLSPTREGPPESTPTRSPEANGSPPMAGPESSEPVAQTGLLHSKPDLLAHPLKPLQSPPQPRLTQQNEPLRVSRA